MLLISTVAGHAPSTLVTSYECGWDEFKDSIAVAIGLLRSQPSTNIIFHFLIVLKSTTSKVLLCISSCLPACSVWEVTGSPISRDMPGARFLSWQTFETVARMEQPYWEMSDMLHCSALLIHLHEGGLACWAPPFNTCVYRWVRLEGESNSVKTCR